jgi:hypothetical protein
MDITVKKAAVIRVIHDLANRRARAFWHHAVYDAFAFSHPSSGKTHSLFILLWPLAALPWLNIAQKSKNTVFIQRVFTVRR